MKKFTSKNKKNLKRLQRKQKKVIKKDVVKKPLSFKIEYNEPKDIRDFKNRFIQLQLKYIRENEVDDYTEDLFNDEIDKFFNKNPADVAWRYDTEELDNIYNEILNKSAKFLESKKLLRDRIEDQITNDFKSFTKANKAFFAKHKSGLKTKLQDYAFENNIIRKKDETLLKYMERLINLFTKEEYKYVPTIEEQRKQQDQAVEKELLELSQIDETVLEPLTVSQTPSPRKARQKARKQEDKIIDDVVDNILNEVENDIINEEIEKVNIQVSGDIIGDIFNKVWNKYKSGYLKGTSYQHKQVKKYAIDNDILPNENEDDLKYVQRILSIMSKEQRGPGILEKLIQKDPEEEIFEAVATSTPIKKRETDETLKINSKIDKLISKLNIINNKINELMEQGQNISEDDYDDLLYNLRNLNEQKNIIIQEIGQLEEQLNVMRGDGLFDNIKNLFKNNKSPATEKMIKNYGDWMITQLRIHRTPVEKVLQKVLNLVSSGEFENVKNKYQYDDIYHLYLYVELKSPDGNQTKYFMTEKSPNIVWQERSSLHSDSSKGNDMTLQPKPVLFKDVIEATMKQMGAEFSRYSAVNNCQVYILELCKSIYQLGGDKLPDNIMTFIWQDVPSQLPRNTLTFSNIITKSAHAFNRLLGKGKKKKVYFL